MRTFNLIGGAMLSIAVLGAAMPAAAQRDYQWHGGGENRGWDAARSYDGRPGEDRVMARDDYVYRGSDRRYYCRRSNGTTGLVVGGIAGGILGSAIGGDTLGTVLGAGAGAVAGSSIERGERHCR